MYASLWPVISIFDFLWLHGNNVNRKGRQQDGGLRRTVYPASHWSWRRGCFISLARPRISLKIRRSIRASSNTTLSIFHNLPYHAGFGRMILPRDARDHRLSAGDGCIISWLGFMESHLSVQEDKGWRHFYDRFHSQADWACCSKKSM